jgi:hypothetical protein
MEEGTAKAAHERKRNLELRNSGKKMLSVFS